MYLSLARVGPGLKLTSLANQADDLKINRQVDPIVTLFHQLSREV